MCLCRVRNKYPYRKKKKREGLLGVIYTERRLCPGKMALKKQMLVKDAVSEQGLDQPGAEHKDRSLSSHLQPGLNAP